MIELTTITEALLAILSGTLGLSVIVLKVKAYRTTKKLNKELDKIRADMAALTSPEAVVNFRRANNGLPPLYTKTGKKL